MKQCLLRRGHTRQIVWIPASLARPAHYLRIHDSDGWLVEQVYAASPLQLTPDGRGFHHLFESIC